jgi:thioredoxin 1
LQSCKETALRYLFSKKPFGWCSKWLFYFGTWVVIEPAQLFCSRNLKMQAIVTDTNFQPEVLENPAPVLVEFGADWCGACDMLAPILEQLREEFHGQIKIAWLDIETCGRVAAEYGIQDIPTLAFFKDGQVVDQISGVVPRQVIAAKLRALLC